MERAKLMVIGRKIKEQKRKLYGDEAPSSKKRVRKNDINTNEVQVTDEELNIAFNELLKNQTEKESSINSDNFITLPICKFIVL